MIRLDIFSDPICPWCMIGKALLDRALDGAPDHPFDIVWHPFRLNPDMPHDGVDRRAYLETKFGADRVAAIEARITEAARDAGLVVDLAAIRRTPNTLDAHRVIHWAGLEHVQTPVVTALFDAYFSAGRDISDPEVLLDIAEGAGMDRAVVGRLLASDADCDEIGARDSRARERGINAVPAFVIAGRHVLLGAQPTQLWRDALNDLKKQAAGGDA